MTIFLIVKGLCLRILANLGTYQPGHKIHLFKSQTKRNMLCVSTSLKVKVSFL